MAKKKTTTKKRASNPKKKEVRLAKVSREKVKKVVSKKAVPKEKVQPPRPKPSKYYEAVGRRKTAVARVRLWTKGDKEFLVNDKPYTKYFPTQELQQTALASLRKMNIEDKFRVVAKVKGGGLVAQAEAIRHAIARALVLFNPNFRKRLRKAGYLTRDPRMRERKKFGLKRARRAPQWQKR